MQTNLDKLIKTALTEYFKAHTEFEGKIGEFVNHIEDAGKVFYSLPTNIQNDLAQLILGKLAANGIIVTKLFNN